MSEQILLLLWLTASIVYMYFMHFLPAGILSAPEAGFFPLLCGTAAALTLILLLLKRPLPAAAGRTVNWSKFCCLLIGFSSYLIFFQTLGVWATTFIFLTYILKLSDLGGWLSPCLKAAIGATAVQFLLCILSFGSLP